MQGWGKERYGERTITRLLFVGARERKRELKGKSPRWCHSLRQRRWGHGQEKVPVLSGVLGLDPRAHREGGSQETHGREEVREASGRIRESSTSRWKQLPWDKLDPRKRWTG